MTQRVDESGAARLEAYRPYLHLLGRLEAGRGLQGKLDLSAVVQRTLSEAATDPAPFRDASDAEVAARLRGIFSRNLIDAVRRLDGQARDAGRGPAAEATAAQSAARIEAWLAADEPPGPGQPLDRHERLRQLAGALAELAPEQRLAVELHHLGGCSLAATAERLGLSRGAAASLVFRGLENLRHRLAPWGDDGR